MRDGRRALGVAATIGDTVLDRGLRGEGQGPVSGRGIRDGLGGRLVNLEEAVGLRVSHVGRKEIFRAEARKVLALSTCEDGYATAGDM